MQDNANLGHTRPVLPEQAHSGLPVQADLARTQVRFLDPTGVVQHMSVSSTWINSSEQFPELKRNLLRAFEQSGCKVLEVKRLREAMVEVDEEEAEQLAELPTGISKAGAMQFASSARFMFVDPQGESQIGWWQTTENPHSFAKGAKMLKQLVDAALIARGEVLCSMQLAVQTKVDYAVKEALGGAPVPIERRKTARNVLEFRRKAA